MEAMIRQIARQFQTEESSISPLSGGDISKVFRIKWKGDDVVIKVNDPSLPREMIETEIEGLRSLYDTESFKIPKVLDSGVLENHTFVALEYIASSAITGNFWEPFAMALATLHRNTDDRFGLDYDNFIGRLPQQNNREYNIVDFYISQRLEPQIKLAADKGYTFKNIDGFLSNLQELLPDEVPSLIHGDLWNGNYICSNSNVPVLIDPSIAYSSREFDLSMMQLFGGFPQQVFDHYNELFPLSPNWEERIEVWQLYYLLVHLNLFGNSYHDSVKHIIDKFS